MTTAKRHSPIEHFVSLRKPADDSCAGGPMARWIVDEASDKRMAGKLGIADLSLLRKVGFKGKGCADWLASQGINLPEELYTFTQLEDGGLVIKVDRNEYFIESSEKDETVANLKAADLAGSEHVYRTTREDATIVLSGERANEVLLQTCGVNFRSHPVGIFAFTRIAGVSCSVLPRVVDDVPQSRIWCDHTFADDLFQTLAQIVIELDGKVVGAGCFL